MLEKRLGLKLNLVLPCGSEWIDHGIFKKCPKCLPASANNKITKTCQDISAP